MGDEPRKETMNRVVADLPVCSCGGLVWQTPPVYGQEALADTRETRLLRH